MTSKPPTKSQHFKHGAGLSLRPSPRAAGRFEIEPVKGAVSFDQGFFLVVRAVQVSGRCLLHPSLRR